MLWIDQRIRDNDVLRPPSGEYDYLRDVLCRERITATRHHTHSTTVSVTKLDAAHQRGTGDLRINSIRLGFVSIKSHHGKFLQTPPLLR